MDGTEELRRVIHRLHSDFHRPDLCSALTITHGIGEAVGAIVVGKRAVDDLGLVLVKRHRPMGPIGHGGDRQRVSVDINVVGHQIGH